MKELNQSPLKKIKFIDIVKEVNKELENQYSFEVVSDVLQTTRKVLLKHILYTPHLYIDLFNIADLNIYEKRITSPMLLEKGSSDYYIKFDIKIKNYIKRFVKKKIINARTPVGTEAILKTGSVSIDDDNIEMDFL